MKNPMHQGSLDCLCGIYSVINALSIVSKKVDKEKMFKKIINFLDKQNLLVEALTQGAIRNTISKILNHVSTNDIEVTRPFWNDKEITLEKYWGTLESHLSPEKNNVAIVWVSGKTWDHWTVIKNITAKQLQCQDSAELKVLKRDNCTTSENNTIRSHIISPTHTFLLSNIT